METTILTLVTSGQNHSTQLTNIFKQGFQLNRGTQIRTLVPLYNLIVSV